MEDEVDYEDGLGEDVEFGLAIDPKGKVLMLVRSDYVDGTMEYRSAGEWVQITPDDVMPILDEHPLTRVDGNAIEIWDEKSESAKEEDFEEHILDK
ncbi:hypothetical protein SEA_ATUIN_73 [Arthrobacter phage Atuin]|nr:hypothetical protein SEA_ATUIN_172 [Arthrobacter phage Atuin]